MQLSSAVFPNGGIIPSRYTCEGANHNPPLDISDVPLEAKSLVLIMEDPDVPRHLRNDGMWDHWIIFNMLPTLQRIDEARTPSSGINGMTTFGHTRYGGPCPPDKEHRYFFKLYALDQMLPIKEGSTKLEVEKAMDKHIIAKAVLMGRYEKRKKAL